MEFRHFLDDVLRCAHGTVENLVVLCQVGSTNGLARRIADDSLADCGRLLPVLVVAFEQRAGRGRRGRRWVSPPGAGIYATYILPLPEGRGLATLPLLAGVGLCRALNRHLEARRCRLKWPNDLLVGGRKIGGLLIELLTPNGEPGAALVGFGVNHAEAEAEPPARGATSLGRESRRPPRLAALLWDLVAGLTAELAHFGDEGYATAEYAGLSAHRAGDRLRCRLGGEVVEGTFRGFDSRGFLRLACGGRERLLSAGELLTE